MSGRHAGWQALLVIGFGVATVVGAFVTWQPDGPGSPPSGRDDWGLTRRVPIPGPLSTQPAVHEAVRSTLPAAGIPDRPDDAVALTVAYVYDGDTIQVTDPATDERTRVRLIGIDTPEGTPTPQCWADEARTRLTELLPEGATVWAAPDAELRDRYDRALRYLWTDDGRFVNYELVAAGAAEALRIAPNTAHAELFAAAQAEAEASRAGRWGAC